MAPERWSALMKTLGLGPEVDTYCRLEAAYAEPHRHYHTAHHVGGCLRELDSARTLAAAPAEVELALWFHDAIYDVRAHDNERRSADWAKAFLADAGGSTDVADRVDGFIMATRHASTTERGDAALLVDIDLSILGQPEAVYDEFERQIRAEYSFAPLFMYRRKRREILQSFLDREHIYALAHFRERYEHAARENLGRAIAALK